MILSESLIRVNADGAPAQIPVTPGSVTHAMLADLLHTDVAERLRVSVNPLPDADGAVLCFFIDARGGDRQLAANPLGTCLYHTGCPIYGDLIFALCEQDSDSAAVSGFDRTQSEQLRAWLETDFAAFLHE